MLFWLVFHLIHRTLLLKKKTNISSWGCCFFAKAVKPQVAVMSYFKISNNSLYLNTIKRSELYWKYDNLSILIVNKYNLGISNSPFPKCFLTNCQWLYNGRVTIKPMAVSNGFILYSSNLNQIYCNQTIRRTDTSGEEYLWILKMFPIFGI